MRYKLCLPLLFKWTDESGTFMQEAAFTRDISTGGLFVTCVKCPQIGANLSLEIMLPPNSGIGSCALRLDATVRAVRTAGAAEEKGFAAAGDLATQKTKAGSTLDSRMHSLSRENPKVH